MFRFLARFNNFTKSLHDPQTRAMYKIKFSNPYRYITLKNMAIYFTVIYGGLIYYDLKKNNEFFRLKLNLRRFSSRIIGSLAAINIPTFMRNHLYSGYASLYNVNIDEIEQPLENYDNFSAFFTRKIKSREINQAPNVIVSPADSKILSFSEVNENKCLIVKGITYKLGELISGQPLYQIEGPNLDNIKKYKENKLYQCILYLSPGDYHRFHSPVNYTIKKRIHIHGLLNPVKETYVKTHEDIYEKNERVSIFGEYDQGKFCMVLVGALNVGSIHLNFDEELKTNVKLSKNLMPWIYKDYEKLDEKGNKLYITAAKGEELGKFNLGSTIVLLFEADPSFKWTIKEGDIVKYGQAIGSTKPLESQ